MSPCKKIEDEVQCKTDVCVGILVSSVKNIHTNYLNYIAFDEALALLGQLKKNNSKNWKRINILEGAFR